MSHTDIILVNIPVTGLQYPSAGTAQLKGVLQSNGFSSRIIDLNLDLFNQSGNEYQLYFDYLTSTGDLNEAQFEFLDSLFDKWVDQLIAFSPKYVGISIFTYQCQPSARILLSKLRLKFHGKIVIGGAGISTNGIASVYNDFGAEMLGSNLIDYFIRGDGEYALLELLKGNTDYPGINNDQYLQLSLDDVPMPEYDDLINLDYMYDNDQKILPINGSRGCVRKCMFCDIVFSNKF